MRCEVALSTEFMRMNAVNQLRNLENIPIKCFKILPSLQVVVELSLAAAISNQHIPVTESVALSTLIESVWVGHWIQNPLSSFVANRNWALWVQLWQSWKSWHLWYRAVDNRALGDWSTTVQSTSHLTVPKELFDYIFSRSTPVELCGCCCYQAARDYETCEDRKRQRKSS